jgi:hypothetical protein
MKKIQRSIVMQHHINGENTASFVHENESKSVVQKITVAESIELLNFYKTNEVRFNSTLNCTIYLLA